MATTTIQEIYNKAPAASASDDDILLVAQNEATKGVKLKDVTAGKSVNAEYAAHLGTKAAPLKVGTRGVPIYIDKNGVPQPCDNIQATVAKDTIAQSSDIGAIEFDRVVIISATNEIVLTLGDGSYAGIEVKIINTTDKTHIIRGTTARDGDSTLQVKQIQTIIWNGSKWEGLSCPRIGEIYVQYPQQEAPEDLFICTKWALQEQYAGAFFRATGGNAAAFINKSDELIKQKDATAKNGLWLNSRSDGTGMANTTAGHNHKVDLAHSSWGGSSKDTNRLDASQENKVSYGDRIPLKTAQDNIYLGSNDNETRPTNFTHQLWLRIA
ncbi:hypothetical protein [Treponema sp. Marseille-Q4130]|uniref:hypothetical protein n=1 Tax=Treponema sp. Marseille-Q4130 TaxID=2766702 RepID=UPI001652A6F0|nr:hypothetical protein [Treponema sp. Marseille-Q4130]MBC6720989.1 hypothetical protein [Treponema sp. Marseille-Q4130]